MPEAEKERNIVALGDIDDPIIKELALNCDQNVTDAIQLSPTEIANIKAYLGRIGSGITFSSIMICGGEQCPMRSKCPLYKLKKHPITKECPFERYASERWFADYVQSLKIDLQDKVERSMILELVEADIVQARANTILSEEGFVMENPIGVNENTGDIIYHKEEHIAVGVRERAQTRRDKILKQLVATRETKIKASEITKDRDPSQYFANLRSKFYEASKRHTEIIDAVVTEKKREGSKYEKVSTDTGEDDPPF